MPEWYFSQEILRWEITFDNGTDLIVQ